MAGSGADGETWRPQGRAPWPEPPPYPAQGQLRGKRRHSPPHRQFLIQRCSHCFTAVALLGECSIVTQPHLQGQGTWCWALHPTHSQPPRSPVTRSVSAETSVCPHQGGALLLVPHLWEPSSHPSPAVWVLPAPQGAHLVQALHSSVGWAPRCSRRKWSILGWPGALQNRGDYGPVWRGHPCP